MRSLRDRIGVIWAITRKDLKIAFRFPKNFIATQLISPLRLFVMFGLVYQTFFVATSNQNVGLWKRDNYVAVLILGAIFYTCANQAFYRFKQSFLNEKYWRTIQIFLTVPISKLDFLLASSCALILELAATVLFYLILFAAYHPVSPLNLIPVVTALYLMIFGLLGISLMHGSFAISNENYLFLFDYSFAGLIFFSCFYYDAGAIPQILRPLVFISPLYHAVELARSTVLHHLSEARILGSYAYLFAFASLAPFAGALFFRKLVRELGVRGF